MLFNSLDFAVFLPVVFLIYWYLLRQSIKLQNVFIVIASYYFYGCWDWRFLFLVLFSTIVDYSIGRTLGVVKNEKHRLNLLWLSIVINLGILGFFKYYNFFLDNFVEVFTFFGSKISPSRLDIILPLGISFYTFQTLSYSIDVYRNKIEPAKDFVSFAAFVSFFPQLVAGPIERATNLLPQFYKGRVLNKQEFIDGLRQILWGLFKKVVIADNCAYYVNIIFSNSEEYNGSTLFIGALLFSFQIYGDFSGYSDVAIGTARLFGFKFMKNFSYPYFSRDIAEFWRRWHISLSTWFRDYLYIPLGGSRGGVNMMIRNTILIFVVSGFWHGANWTFIIWGALNALYFIPLILTNKNRNNLEVIAQNVFLPSIKELVSMIGTFLLVVLSWVFFRAEDVSQAVQILSEIVSVSLFSKPDILPKGLFMMIVFFMSIEWVNREKEYGMELSNNNLSWIGIVADVFVLAILFWSIVVWSVSEEVEFIYFQF